MPNIELYVTTEPDRLKAVRDFLFDQATAPVAELTNEHGDETFRFDMSDWVTDAVDAEELPCGTACCIGGAAALRAKELGEIAGIEGATVFPLRGHGVPAGAWAREYLGLCSDRLFHTGDWPVDHRDRYLLSSDWRVDALIAVELLDAILAEQVEVVERVDGYKYLTVRGVLRS